MNYRILPFATALLVAQAQIPAPAPGGAAVPGTAAAPAAASAPAPQSEPMSTGAEAGQPRPAALAGNPEAAPVERTIRTLDYRLVRSGARIQFQGNSMHADTRGKARIRTRDGVSLIEARFEKLPAPSTFGEANLTYVLWAVSPEGMVRNLGELPVKHGRSRIRAVEQLPAFGLIVTAEPHYAVSRPSDAVVMENAVGKDTPSQVQAAQAKLELMPQSGYSRFLTAAATPVGETKGCPPEVLQARQSVRIAEGAGAGQYARDVLDKAQTYLAQAESTKARSRDRLMTARAAAAAGEEARIAAAKARTDEAETQERRLAEARIEQARQEAARAAAAKEEALKQASRASQENEGLRSRLMAELSGILRTKATARGLIVSMSGVLFKTGQATLLPPAREKLAKVAGILATHKGLRIQAEGFTDSTGSQELNARLSEQRATAARDFLVNQGVSAQAITVKGFGSEHPIADNATPAGRQENRRVELVVSGEGITPSTANPEEATPAGPAPEEEASQG